MYPVFFDCNCFIGPVKYPFPGMVSTVAELLAVMDDRGINEALVCHAFSRDISPSFGNMRLLEEIAGHDRLHPCWVAAPGHCDDAMDPDELAAALLEHNVGAVRMYPGSPGKWSNSQGYTLCPATTDPLLQVLEELRTVLLLDMSTGGFSFEQLGAVCERYPRLQVVLSRAYWTTIRDLLPLLQAHGNLFLETSLFQLNNGFKVICEKCGPDRLVFGTNLPNAEPGAAMAMVMLSDISEEQRRLIASGNIRRLLGISAGDEQAQASAQAVEVSVPVESGRQAVKPKPVTACLPANLGIIDAHGHLGPYNGSWIPDNNTDALVKQMDRLGIEKLCLTSTISLSGDCAAGNDDLAQSIARHPDRLIGYATANPFLREDSVRELTRCFDNLGYRMIKVHTSAIEYPLEGAWYLPIWEFAQSRQAVVLAHTSGGAGEIGAYAKIAAAYPQVTWILAHAGNSWRNIDNYIKAAKACSNIYLEITFSTATYGLLPHLCSQVGGDRVLFGSDMLWRGPESQLGWVAYSHLTDNEKRRILRENMLGILRRHGVIA